MIRENTEASTSMEGRLPSPRRNNPHMRRRSPMVTPRRTLLTPPDNRNTESVSPNPVPQGGTTNRSKEQERQTESETSRQEQSPQQSSASPQQTQKPAKRSTKSKRPKRMLAALFPYNTVGLKPPDIELGQARKPRNTAKRQSQENPRTKRAELFPCNAVGRKPEVEMEKPESQPQEPGTSKHPKRMLVALFPYNEVGLKPSEVEMEDSYKPQTNSRMVARLAHFNNNGKEDAKIGPRRTRRRTKAPSFNSRKAQKKNDTKSAKESKTFCDMERNPQQEQKKNNPQKISFRAPKRPKQSLSNTNRKAQTIAFIDLECENGVWI